MTTDQICTAILLMPHTDFEEGAARRIIEAIKGRLEVCNFKHRDHAINAIESLEDAATVLEVAREEILAEGADE